MQLCLPGLSECLCVLCLALPLLAFVVLLLLQPCKLRVTDCDWSERLRLRAARTMNDVVRTFGYH